MRRSFLIAVMVTSAFAALVAPVPDAEAATVVGPWTRVSTGNSVNFATVGMVRTGNDVLHLVWNRDDGSDDRYGHTAIRPNGDLAGIDLDGSLANWNILSQDPQLVRDDGGLRIIFTGQRIPGTYNSGEMYTAFSSNSGNSWSLEPGSMSETSVGTYGSGAAMDGAVPVASWTDGFNVTFHRGISGSIPAPSGDTTLSHQGCCTYDTELARNKKTGAMFLGYYSNASENSANGIFVRRVLPSVGPRTRAPLSSVNGESLDPGGGIPLVSRNGGGVYTAYCEGWPTCERIRVWKVGTDHARSVRGSGDTTTNIWLAAAPGGRLWVMWIDVGSQELHATRSNKDVTQWGPVRTFSPPQGAETVWRIQGDGGRGPLDVIINAERNGANNFWHRVMRPRLTLKMNPSTFDNDNGATLQFRVMDAGDPVPNARIMMRNNFVTTNSDGRATWVIPPGHVVGHHQVTASKPGYTSHSKTLVVTG